MMGVSVEVIDDTLVFRELIRLGAEVIFDLDWLLIEFEL